MAKIGLTVDSLQIQSIDDLNSGYIDAMAAPHNAAIQRQAQIAQAQADQAAAEARQESQRKQAEYERQTAVVQAQYKAEIDRAQAEGGAGRAAHAGAGPGRGHQCPAELAQRRAELRQRELVAEVVKPAEAEAEKVRILAKADAERMRIQAEAAASNDRVALDRMLIDQLPADRQGGRWRPGRGECQRAQRGRGLSEIAAGLVGQGLTILDSIKKNLATGPEARPGQREGSACRTAAGRTAPAAAAAGKTGARACLGGCQAARMPILAGVAVLAALAWAVPADRARRVLADRSAAARCCAAAGPARRAGPGGGGGARPGTRRRSCR